MFAYLHSNRSPLLFRYPFVPYVSCLFLINVLPLFSLLWIQFASWYIFSQPGNGIQCKVLTHYFQFQFKIIVAIITTCSVCVCVYHFKQTREWVKIDDHGLKLYVWRLLWMCTEPYTLKHQMVVHLHRISKYTST